jgi:hypothetical protein
MTKLAASQPAPAQFVHQGRGNCRGARGGERYRQQPRLDVAAVSGREVEKAERLAEGIELPIAGLRTGRIPGEHIWLGADLLGHEAERFGRDQLTGPQQPAGVAQGTKLQGEAEPAVITPAAFNDSEVGGAQGPLPNQGRLVGWQSSSFSSCGSVNGTLISKYGPLRSLAS